MGSQDIIVIPSNKQAFDCTYQKQETIWVYLSFINLDFLAEHMHFNVPHCAPCYTHVKNLALNSSDHIASGC